MKSFFLLPFLTLLTVPVTAGELLPNLYASEYCSLRDLGVSHQEANRAAISTAYLNNNVEPPKVTIGGKQYSVDVVRAVRAQETRCPQY